MTKLKLPSDLIAWTTVIFTLNVIVFQNFRFLLLGIDAYIYLNPSEYFINASNYIIALGFVVFMVFFAEHNDTGFYISSRSLVKQRKKKDRYVSSSFSGLFNNFNFCM